MIGSHLIYQKTRTDAREKIDSDKCPFWVKLTIVVYILFFPCPRG